MLDSDLFHSWSRAPAVMLATVLAIVLVAGSLLAPWVAPHNPFDPATLDLNDALLPPSWLDGGQAKYLFGTDDQGRDILSTLLYGCRISLLVGLASMALAALTGVAIGLLAGWRGGRTDAILMRLADVQLSFPAILIALLLAGIARSALAGSMELERAALAVLVGSVALSRWVDFARTVRGSTLVERNREYVLAARVIGVPAWRILVRHILPNVTGPLLVIGTVNIAVAIVTEATLSFLGVGMPPTSPSLGTMVQTGNNFLYSGEWWLVVFPGGTLLVLCMSINLIGDWLRDALNPRLS